MKPIDAEELFAAMEQALMPMLPSAPAAAPSTHEPPVNAAAPLSFADRRRQSDQPKAGAQLYRQTGAQRRSGRQWRRSAEPAANGALRRHSNGFADAGNGRRRSGTGDSSGRAAATGGRTDAADHRHDRTRHERRQRKCLQLGFDGYIAKPILLEKLAEEITQVVAAPVLAFDYPLALAQLDNDPALFNELAAMFIDELPGLLNTLQAAIAAQTCDEIKRCAHRLKGETLHFAGSPLTPCLQAIEQAAGARDLARRSSLQSQLAPLSRQLRDALIAIVEAT